MLRICPACAGTIDEQLGFQECPACRRNYHTTCRCPEHPTAQMVAVRGTRDPMRGPQPTPSGTSPRTVPPPIQAPTHNQSGGSSVRLIVAIAIVAAVAYLLLSSAPPGPGSGRSTKVPTSPPTTAVASAPTSKPVQPTPSVLKIRPAPTLPAPPQSTTYTSPTFGYTIGYGPTWTESENVSTDGRDRFVLFHGKSYITFTGERAFNGDPQACVEAFVKQLTADPKVSNPELTGEGRTAATGAYAIYNHDYTFSDRVESYTLYVSCIPLIPNEAVLAVVQNVPAADYEEEVELRQALLLGLTLAQ